MYYHFVVGCVLIRGLEAGRGGGWGVGGEVHNSRFLYLALPLPGPFLKYRIFLASFL